MPVRDRMLKMSLRNVRKIRVKDHLLGPLKRGEKPSSLHCLQASRIVADELTVRLGRYMVLLMDNDGYRISIVLLMDIEFLLEYTQNYRKYHSSIV